MLQGSSLGQFYKQYLEPIKLNDILVSWETSDLWHHLQILSALEDVQSLPLHVCVMLLSHHVADRCQPKAHEIEMLSILIAFAGWLGVERSELFKRSMPLFPNQAVAVKQACCSFNEHTIDFAD
jgi:hypothetical protein